MHGARGASQAWAIQDRVQVLSAKVGHTDTFSGSMLFTNAPMPMTVAARDEKDQLITAVTNMALSQPALEFANRFLFTTDMIVGGQGVVVFARGRDAGMRQYAIKYVSPCPNQATPLLMLARFIAFDACHRSYRHQH
jgi:hypothetical protein